MSNDLGSPYIGVKPSLSAKATPGTNILLVEKYIETGYDYVLLSITNTNYREKSRKIFQKAKNSNDITVPSPNLSDVNIFAGPQIKNTIGLLSSWIELESDDELISEFSKQVLVNELEYAKFIGLKHIIIAPPKDLIKLPNYSKSINDALDITENHHITISISLPLCEEIQDPSRSQPIDSLSTWDMWNSIRITVDYNPRLKVSLAIPKAGIPINVVERWFAEPVSVLLMSSSIFILNNKGYPVLTKANQSLMHHFHIKKPIYLLHGLDKIPEEVESSSYMTYINYILVRNQLPMSKIDKIAAKHHDVLLPPLQPLGSDLDDFTYNIFEEDNVKYDLYGKAIYCALSELSHLRNINIAIVGAGKGGLVEATMDAIHKLALASTKINITAIEKNNSAVIYLNKRNYENWNHSVDILNIDMRDWSPHESYNLIISELLGSMGCNELSPECLAPLEKYLDRVHGIFIPESYTSFIAPTFTPKIYNTLKTQNNPQAFHKQYVVKQLESCLSSTKINEIWSFQHPTLNRKSHKRKTISTFKIRHKTVIHGISGFFTAKLYKDIEISIRPDIHTPDLVSWFPLFFPLEQPLYVTDDTELEIQMTRETMNGKVWYEWCIESFMYLVIPGENSNEYQMRVRTGITKLHNHRGKGFAMDLNLNYLTN